MPKQRVLTIALLMLVASACSSSSPHSKTTSAPPTTATTASTKPPWLQQLNTPADLRAETYNGTTVYVSDSERNVYAQRCDDAKALTSAGGKYGPTPRNADNTGGQNGYQYTCFDH